MDTTRSGEHVSPQIAKMGPIDCSAGDFSLPDGQVFNIKNDGDQAVKLTVRLAGMDAGETVTTTFDCGWNPEIVKTVIQDSQSLNLMWGY